MVTRLEAIQARRSRRKYLQAPISAPIAERLQALLDAYCAEGDVDMRLVLNNGDAWNGLLKSYGMFSGVQSYAGLIHQKGDVEALERLGYYGELWVLEATALGLGTCWVGGSFRRALCPFDLKEDQMIACTIAVGNVEASLSGKEAIIRRITHRKVKTVEEMSVVQGDAPAWFAQGMQAVLAAPSAVNRQPVTFRAEQGCVTASIPDVTDMGAVLDLGIAKLHFALGAGGGAWTWGNGGAFQPGDAPSQGGAVAASLARVSPRQKD